MTIAQLLQPTGQWFTPSRPADIPAVRRNRHDGRGVHQIPVRRLLPHRVLPAGGRHLRGFGGTVTVSELAARIGGQR
jgi:hypothetical protein